jgi:ubiquinone/menaquinone biosynthesis C-methylase UbiE
MAIPETIDELNAALQRNERISNEEWLASLSERKKKELEFHDRDRDRSGQSTLDSDTYERFYGNKKYYKATSRSKRFVENWIAEHVPGRVFLDYACGNGAQAITAARHGARLSVGIDISRTSIENARADARLAGVESTTRFVQADAENTKLPDGSIDVVLCSGMLHHLDLSFAFPELRRILAKGGRILAVEALDYNPAIKLYRMLTPQMRTEWESAHILSFADIKFARRFFDVSDIRYWHITSISAPHLPFIPASAFDSIDYCLERLPGIQLMAWMFTFVMTKKASDS